MAIIRQALCGNPPATYYIIRDGMIDPWGTIRILEVGEKEKEPIQNWEWKQTFVSQPGLLLWNAAFVEHGRQGHRAQIGRRDIEILSKEGVVAHVPFRKCIHVQIREKYVHSNGYLEYVLSRNRPDNCSLMAAGFIDALDQAAKGKKPDRLDNSKFVRIDPKYAGQEVIEVSRILDRWAVVYTREGELIPSKLHRPLALGRWAADGLE